MFQVTSVPAVDDTERCVRYAANWLLEGVALLHHNYLLFRLIRDVTFGDKDVLKRLQRRSSTSLINDTNTNETDFRLKLSANYIARHVAQRVYEQTTCQQVNATNNSHPACRGKIGVDVLWPGEAPMIMTIDVMFHFPSPRSPPITWGRKPDVLFSWNLPLSLPLPTVDERKDAGTCRVEDE
ncbi:hypothetical protein J6590_062732 [Homalodisca vitripennis]|nr:hypothetical protein J6590_062732 [Homalodisca vitripennis]